MDFLKKHSTATNPVLRIVVLTLLVVLPFVGFEIGMQYQSLINVSGTENQLPNIQPKSTSPTSNASSNTSGWETYENKEYSFSFKYPSEYTLKDVTGTGNDGANVPWKITLNKTTSIISVNIQKRECKNGAGEEQVIIDKKTGVRSLEKDVMDGIMFSTDRVEIPIESNLCFIIEKYADTKGKASRQENTSEIYESIFNQDKVIFDTILSSIKFTSSPETMCENKWCVKTINGSREGWSGLKISYPEAWNLRDDGQAFKESKDVFTVSVWGPTQKGRTELYDGASFAIGEPIKSSQNVKQWVRSYYGEKSGITGETYVYSTVTINGRDYETMYACGLGCFTYYHFRSGDYIYRIMTIANGSNADVYKKEIDKMLTSIKPL